ncbi:uncharacterized protein ACNLHF_001414 [Anomaloglossus baeobatrachus]|uniref:uncharacterized protein LOC142250781 n=1 Tax=Anomaloglossus baeobatrachus TaxID=238106 RepID=UPI003F50C0AB
MSRNQKESNVHKVKIQQIYWAKDTTEEKMAEMGAIRTEKVLEEVEYYDTDLYDLAVNESWLSKTGKAWQLITDKMKATNLENPRTIRTKQIISDDPKTESFPRAKTEPDPDPNGNTELETSRNILTCYELIQEEEIIACLSRILQIHAESDNAKIGKFLEKAGIQKYTSVRNVRQETFRLRDIYTVVIKADGVSTKKTAVISMDVEIDNVTKGFQRVEQLANELDLQAQHVQQP